MSPPSLSSGAIRTRECALLACHSLSFCPPLSPILMHACLNFPLHDKLKCICTILRSTAYFKVHTSKYNGWYYICVHQSLVNIGCFGRVSINSKRTLYDQLLIPINLILLVCFITYTWNHLSNIIGMYFKYING